MDATKEGKYFSKEHPEDLMPQEILERVPELYGQEEIALADKEVYLQPMSFSFAQTGPGILPSMTLRPIMPLVL